ncbi:MAG: hypothetical protein ACYSYM_11295 [Planctomycetota bacterium]|jgi:hypothetical protein
MPSDVSIMEIHNDFKELLELFNKHKVEYLIVGGYALAFHGAPHLLIGGPRPALQNCILLYCVRQTK